MARTLIGLKLREARRALGITQAALAGRVRISPSYLNLIEGDRRNISGALLKRIADALSLPLEQLDGAAERRLVDELAELARDPMVAPLALDPATASDLASRQPGWARALVTLYRACMDRDQAITALSDRLDQDPLLAEAVHGMLTNVAAIRSAAEILESESDLDADRRRRFVSIIAGDSRRLSNVSLALAGFFGRADSSTRSVTPAEEVDDFIASRDNFFARLEDAALALRDAAGLGSGSPEEALTGHLLKAHGILVRRVAAWGDTQPATGRAIRFVRETGVLELLDTAPEHTRRFLLARMVAELGAARAIENEVGAAPALGSGPARARAAAALASYVAGAMLIPYDAFVEMALDARYDLDKLARRFDVSFEQACHRLVTLRRPGSEGLRFGFLRSDPSGHVQKRFSLPRLPLPRYGAVCPLWPVHTAFQSPGATVRQVVEFPAGERYLMMARTVDKERGGPGMPRRLMSIMLMCDALHADGVVYGDGLDLSPAAPAIPVGQTCRTCVRRACAYRQEDPIVDAGFGEAGDAWRSLPWTPGAG